MSRKNIGNDGNQVNPPKFDKNVARTLPRGCSAPCYIRIRGHERLSGGADAKSKTTVDVTKPSPETNSKVIPEPSDGTTVAMEAEKEIEAILAQSNNREAISDKKVDEMIDYVIQNLQEAGKALASLGGENFEHDLKLMFVDIMGKVQNWVSLAQIRLDTARDDLKNLRLELFSRMNELAAREREITELKKKLAESEISKGAYEKALAESAQKIAAQLPTPSTMSFVPSRQPMPTEVSSAPLGQHAVDSQHHTDQTSASMHPLGASATLPQSSQPVPPVERYKTLPAREENLQEATLSATLQDQQKITLDEKQGSARNQGPATTDVAVQSEKGKESRRESKLESELARLRKDNEKIAKERSDYENAIQRALIRGVSSLNAETLKVLRCPPPVSCYTPCGPPSSPVNTVETMTPCLPMKKKDDRAAGCRTLPTISLRHGSKMRVEENPPVEERGCCRAKRPTTSTYGSSSRCRKSSGSSSSSMALILQQAVSPAVCSAPCNKPRTRSWSRSKSKKPDSSTCTKKLE